MNDENSSGISIIMMLYKRFGLLFHASMIKLSYEHQYDKVRTIGELSYEHEKVRTIEH